MDSECARNDGARTVLGQRPGDFVPAGEGHIRRGDVRKVGVALAQVRRARRAPEPPELHEDVRALRVHRVRDLFKPTLADSAE